MRDQRERPGRPTTCALVVDGGKHAVALGVSAGVWFAALASSRVSWDAEGAAVLARGVGALLVLVLVGHLLPTALLRQVSWLWSSFATAGAVLAWTVLSAGTSRSDVLATVPFGLLIVVLPVLVLTTALRTFVRPLRPTRALRTPLTAAMAHTPDAPAA